MTVARIRFENITQSYGKDRPILENFNLDISDGEFVVLLGPSGCGKSTLLKLLAGFEKPNAGKIFIGDREVTSLESRHRGVAMVFQNYALYPHMTVEKNIGISLMLKKIPQEEIRQKVHEVADMLSLTPYLNRRPSELSGGQQQRVALGRALIHNPDVYLLDEPLSNLDAALRIRMREEIMSLYHKLKTTMIYVTHDQTEAMTMATRIVLLNEGRIMQDGTPDELYRLPANTFVAGFIGTIPMNLIKIASLSELQEDFPFYEAAQEMNFPCILGIRPEDIRIKKGSRYRIQLIENLGNEKIIHLTSYEKSKHKFSVRLPYTFSGQVGEHTDIYFDRAHIFPDESI